MNVGHFSKKEYSKFTSLKGNWKELWVHGFVMDKIVADDIRTLKFIDRRLKKMWVFVLSDVREHGAYRETDKGRIFAFPVKRTRKKVVSFEE